MNQILIGVEEMAKKLDVPVSWLYARTRINEVPHGEALIIKLR
jgi:hypothetical protein